MTSIGSYTDRGLRETVVELEKAERLDSEERERLIRILSETETAINVLGTRIMASRVVRYEFLREQQERNAKAEAGSRIARLAGETP